MIYCMSLSRYVMYVIKNHFVKWVAIKKIKNKNKNEKIETCSATN